jgi:hypothetical protein
MAAMVEDEAVILLPRSVNYQDETWIRQRLIEPFMPLTITSLSALHLCLGAVPASESLGGIMSSLARKLTPAKIGKPKVNLDIAGRVYSHEHQLAVGDEGVIYMTTWNATQTFNSRGQPTDKDNDK